MDRLGLLLPLAGSALFGALLFVEIEEEPVLELTGTSQAVVPAEAGPARTVISRSGNAGRADVILARPLFSLDRRPEPPATAAPSDAAPDPGEPRLTGIITTGNQSFALFARLGGKPFVASAGQALGNWTVDSIASDAVVLRGAAGTKTLTPSFDPNRAVAAAPAIPTAATPLRLPPTPQTRPTAAAVAAPKPQPFIPPPPSSATSPRPRS
jgi:hypothetical protein